MSVNALKQLMPDYAKDTKLNLSKVISEDSNEGLSLNQTYGIALASAYTTQHPAIINAIYDEVQATLSEAEVQAAKAAATIMGMNNVYYRFMHLVGDPEYSKLPANLRMNIVGNPGIEKVDFELMSLAVSAINGCGMCIEAHVNEVSKAGISKQGVQSSVRIAAVLAAAAQALVIERAGEESGATGQAA